MCTVVKIIYHYDLQRKLQYDLFQQGVVLLNIVSKLTFVSSILATKDTSAMEPAGWMIFVYSNAGKCRDMFIFSNVHSSHIFRGI